MTKPTAPIILVPLDGSLHSLDALPIAHTLARIKSATIHVLHIGERRLPPTELFAKLGVTEASLEGSMLDQGSGDPGEQIGRFANDWSDAVIVMCTHAGSPTIAGALGRAAARVLRDAGCPVVLVRPERGARAWELREVLVAHDGTPSTTVCICPAAELSRLAGARLSVLHVAAASAAPPTEAGTIAAPRYVDQRQHEWPAWAAEFTERLASTCPVDPTTLRLSLATGDPGEAVVRHAREHDTDLIVAAWHGSLEDTRAPVLKAALRDAPCPVMVLRMAN